MAFGGVNPPSRGQCDVAARPPSSCSRWRKQTPVCDIQALSDPAPATGTTSVIFCSRTRGVVSTPCWTAHRLPGCLINSSSGSRHRNAAVLVPHVGGLISVPCCLLPAARITDSRPGVYWWLTAMSARICRKKTGYYEVCHVCLASPAAKVKIRSISFRLLPARSGTTMRPIHFASRGFWETHQVLWASTITPPGWHSLPLPPN